MYFPRPLDICLIHKTHMARITLSIPDETYTLMRKHPEINWSEIARRNIVAKTLDLTKSIDSHRLFEALPEHTKKGIMEGDEKFAAEYSKKVREKGWKRTRYLTQA